MELTTVREIFKNREAYLDKEIQVGGWVRSNRDSKTFGFIVLHDGTFFETLQIVYHDTQANFAEIAKINVGAAILDCGKPSSSCGRNHCLLFLGLALRGLSPTGFPQRLLAV